MKTIQTNQEIIGKARGNTMEQSRAIKSNQGCMPHLPVYVAHHQKPLGSMTMERTENPRSSAVTYDGWSGRVRGRKWCNAWRKNKMQMAALSPLSVVEPIRHGVDGRPKCMTRGSVRRHGKARSQRSYVGMGPVRAQLLMTLHEAMIPSQSMHECDENQERKTEKTRHKTSPVNSKTTPTINVQKNAIILRVLRSAFGRIGLHFFC